MSLNFYDSWHWLENHPVFKVNGEIRLHLELIGIQPYSVFNQSFSIEVVRVNSETKCIEDKKDNDLIQVWVECFPQNEYGHSEHNYDLDSGGDNFEEAIIQLAKKVKNIYGDY
jgi:hypothetical protein